MLKQKIAVLEKKNLFNGFNRWLDSAAEEEITELDDRAKK